MKVVLFCGGFGTRMREYSETLPKPLVEIGPRPIIWHLMRSYASYGFKEFILCLGYRSEAIKEYFLNYDECRSNDFRLSEGGRKVELLNRDIDDWEITFVDTGLTSNIGQRLLAVRDYVKSDEVFLANYSDGLSDIALDEYLAWFKASDAVASFVSVVPAQSTHTVKFDGARVTAIRPVATSDFWINAGFFAFRPAIFQYMKPGEELVEKPFRRLIEAGKLITWKHDGFWRAIDTYKDWRLVNDMYESGNWPLVRHEGADTGVGEDAGAEARPMGSTGTNDAPR